MEKELMKIHETARIAPGALIHDCTIGNNCLIGMDAIILNGAVIEDNARHYALKTLGT